MLGVFKQTYKKLLFKGNTIIMLVVLVFLFGSSYKNIVPTKFFHYQLIESMVSSILIAFNTLFIWFVLPIFVAMKAVGFISDEIQDGTFLTILSKPISRKNILIQKFAALQLVIVSFIIASIGIVWFFTLLKYPFGATWSFMQKTVGPIMLTAFVVEIILSVVLVTLSLKLKPAFIISIGFAFALISLVLPSFQPALIKNGRYQRVLGDVITVEKYNLVTEGQEAYRKFNWMDFTQHANQIYATTLTPTLKKYGLDNTTAQVFNQEVIFTKVLVTEKNKSGETVEVVKYKSTAHKLWHKDKTLRIAYLVLSLFTLLFGFVYFSRKDIV